MSMSGNNKGPGPIQPKSGINHEAINRGAGYSATMGGMDSKTRSPAQGTSMNNLYKSVPGEGLGGNVRGYGDCCR